MPYERWLQVCVGMMGMSLTEFWSSSIREINLAVEGFMEFNGGKKEPMNRNRLEELMERYPDS